MTLGLQLTIIAVAMVIGVALAAGWFVPRNRTLTDQLAHARAAAAEEAADPGVRIRTAAPITPHTGRVAPVAAVRPVAQVPPPRHAIDDETAVMAAVMPSVLPQSVWAPPSTPTWAAPSCDAPTAAFPACDGPAVSS
jgi:hypothetical protein